MNAAFLTPQKNLNVLVVDDEEGIRDVLSALLEEIGAKVWLATNGMEAMRILEKRSKECHLVISDMRMPHMDGPSLLKQMKQAGLKDPKFLLMTGDIHLDFNRKDLELGQAIDGYFPKPFNLVTVTDALQRLGFIPKQA